MIRIARALAMAGLGARRTCEDYVLQGLVQVNGTPVATLGTKVDPDKDAILFRGKPVRIQQHVYYLLHKPEGYTTTVSDRHARQTVFELLPSELGKGADRPDGARSAKSHTRVFPVGRLDRDTTGLLLLTNDGELANRLVHPRYQVGKWYDVQLHRPLQKADAAQLIKGLELEEGLASVKEIKMLSPRRVRVLLKEGRKREIRRLFDLLQYTVTALCRTDFGPLTLGELAPGEGRFLTAGEIAQLRELVKLA